MTNIIWMDGGILFELNRINNDFGETATTNNQEIIYNLYKNYIEIGAKCITTNNYAFKPNRHSNWRELCIKIAPTFIDLKLKYPNTTILGSVPPFHHTYNSGPINENFLNFYRQLIPILNLYVDAFIVETQVDQGHCDHICNIITTIQPHKPIFMSVYPDKITCEDLWRLTQKYNQITTILINCCNFKRMSEYYNNEISRLLAAQTRLVFGFYLNKIDETKYNKTKSANQLQQCKLNSNETDKIKEFIDSYEYDKLYVGGCCGYGVKEMRELIDLNK